MAVWLNISIEALPFVAAVGVWFGLLWLAEPKAGERLKYFLASLAVASASLFALTHRASTWFGHPHDVLNIAHLAGFAVAALGSHVLVHASANDLRKRLVTLAGVGIVAAAAMFAVDPHVLSDPFSSLDPLVSALWYTHVDEGQPIWLLPVGDAAIGLAQPLVGLAAGLFAVWKCAPEHRSSWIAYTYLMFAMTLASVFVIREATTASVLSMPGTAFLCDFALRRTRNVSLMPLRIVGTTGAFLIMAPAYAAPALLAPTNPKLVEAMHSSGSCTARSELMKLNVLPPSDLLAPLDITPAILASTHHRAVASGYHRNDAGIHDVIVSFIGSPEAAKAVVAKRHVAYVVLCPNAPESIRWANNGPSGLAATLNAGRSPDWLEPVPIRGLSGLRVWKVRATS